MAEIKCPCGLRNHMEEEDCKKTNCNTCCPLTKPQTNADRIRAMSDDELAKLLWAILHERDVIMIEKLSEQGIEASLIETPGRDIAAHLEWLKQPVE